MKITFHTDPGHGWLEVPRQVLDELGIAAKITLYSYQHENNVYLEEDLDAGTFIDAAKAAGMKLDIVDRYASNTPIRGYRSYRPA